MIFVLIYLLIGTVITLVFEHQMLRETDRYANEHGLDQKMRKIFRRVIYIITILFWPTLFIPHKKGDNKNGN